MTIPIVKQLDKNQYEYYKKVDKKVNNDMFNSKPVYALLDDYCIRILNRAFYEDIEMQLLAKVI